MEWRRRSSLVPETSSTEIDCGTDLIGTGLTANTAVERLIPVAWLDRDALATLGAPARQHCLPALRLHAAAESMSF